MQDAVLATGGAVVAKSTSDQIYWKTPPRGIIGLAGSGDLDGDGKLDIVAYSSDHAYVISAITGSIEWAEPDGEMGALGSVRVGDVNGDGKPEIVVTECGCCGVNSGKSGFVWSFGAGFGAAQSLGSLQVFTCGTSQSVTLGNADGVGALEILLADYDHFALLKSDGSVLAQTGNQGTRVAENSCTPANIDGVAGDEFVCILNSGDAPATNQRKVTVLQYDAVTPALNVLWSKIIAPDAGGNAQWVDPVVDLDGDGKYELVISTQDTALWQTRIYDALTGAEFTPAIGSGQIVQGTVAAEVANKRLVLTSSGTDLTAWSFARSPQPTLTQRWQIAGQALLTYGRADLIQSGAINRVALALDLDGDGLDDFVTRSTAQPAVISAYSGAGGTSKQIATYALHIGTDPGSAWVLPAISTKAKSQVGLVTTDGILSLLDTALHPTNDPSSPAKPIAIKVGGYYASGAWRETSNAPRVRALGSSKAESILVPDSRKSLLRFDGVQASWAVPPPATWAVSHTYAPTIVDKLDGANPGAACLALQEPVTNPPHYRVRAVRGDGSILWDVPTESAPLTDLATGDLNADGVPDFVLQWAAPSDVNLVTRAFSGVDGSTLWETSPIYPGAGGTQSPGVSIGKFGSGLGIYFQGNATRVLDGVTGNQVAQGGTPNAYSLPILFDTNGDGSNEVVLTSGYWPVSLYSSDLQSALWVSGDDDRPYPYAGVAQCGTSLVPTLVQGSWQNPARLKMTPLAGGSLGTLATVVLAGGKTYANETAAKADGAFLGQLTSVNVHSNLTGANHPTAVVGSADGWVYGVNPCSGALDFTLNVGAAVGEAVFGDTDGDGRDEIIVTAADGYLYDIKNEAIPQSAYVWDIDPDHGITDHDVDTIVTTDTLSGAWAPVTGATGYEVTVVNKDGLPLPTPIWKNVGTATTTTLSGMKLATGDRYFFAVRALSAKGPSVDTLSNGVTVVTGDVDGGVGDSSPDAGTVVEGDGGCGCELAQPQSTPARLGGVGALALVLFARRRRR